MTSDGEQNRLPVTAPVACAITARGELVVDAVNWRVNEFDDGRAYMLVAAIATTQFSAHFDAEQWAAFQGLVVPTGEPAEELGLANMAVGMLLALADEETLDQLVAVSSYSEKTLREYVAKIVSEERARRHAVAQRSRQESGRGQ